MLSWRQDECVCFTHSDGITHTSVVIFNSSQSEKVLASSSRDSISQWIVLLLERRERINNYIFHTAH